MVWEAKIYSIMQLIIKTKAFWHQSLKMLFYVFLSFKYTKYIESFRFLNDIKRQTKSIKFNAEWLKKLQKLPSGYEYRLYLLVRISMSYTWIYLVQGFSCESELPMGINIVIPTRRSRRHGCQILYIKDTEVPRCQDNQCFFCLCCSSDASPGQQRRNWSTERKSHPSSWAVVPRPWASHSNRPERASAFPFSVSSDLFLSINFHTSSLGTAFESSPPCSVLAAHQKGPHRLFPACLLLDQTLRKNFTRFSNGLACYWSLNPKNTPLKRFWTQRH